MSENPKPKFAVIGAGHGGLAMAGHLAIMGFEVNLYNRSEERLWGVKSTGGIRIESDFGLEGFGEIRIATTDMKEAIENVDIIMVVVPATAHRFIAEQMGPHLKDGQIIVLNPGRTFGALEFKQVLNSMNIKTDVILAETQTFIYASRAIGPGQAKIFRIKNSIPIASIRAHLIPEVLKKLRIAYPQFVPGDNIFKTSFDNIGAVFHPTLCILNAGWIEDVSDFQFYVQGVTPSVAKVLEEVDSERVKVAEALGIRSLTAREWLYLAYSASGDTLYDAMMANPGYRGILAPKRLNMRYLTEDVPTSLVPIASVGKKLGVETPTINSLIHLASLLNQTDYWEIGRTVERLNIADLSLRELRLLAIGEKL
ncbi:MAG: NAD/NADP octopine/nopaline dehydrogenase family protein [Ignavibacteria bacterium]|jgi:opine dehydrogenase|nr:NAD/NADP octopine/nopaline dehydrogenase family protein [Ignavibacteria bacterium]MDH7528352.1 NAD/NADP octopine/nopaline dehydrogenase family protein [Ignavibacteria bacterium]